MGGVNRSFTQPGRRRPVAAARLVLRTFVPGLGGPRTTAEALLGRVTRAQGWLLATTLVLRLTSETLPLAKPWLVGALVDQLSNPEALTASGPLLGLFLLASMQSVATLGYGVASARLGLRTVRAVRQELTGTWLHHGRGGLSVGDALTRTGRDVGRLRAFTDRVFVRSLTGTIRGVLPALVLLALDPFLAGAALCLLPIQRFGVVRLEARIESASRRASEAHAALFEGLERFFRDESCSSIADELAKQSGDLEKEELGAARFQAAIRAWVVLGTGIGIAVVWTLGSRRVDSGAMSLGELVSFAGYVALAYRPFRQLAGVSKTFSAGTASLERVAEALDRARRSAVL